jgi:hypothetical protein
MSALARHASDYLRLRRALGFKLTRQGDELASWSASATPPTPPPSPPTWPSPGHACPGAPRSSGRTA